MITEIHIEVGTTVFSHESGKTEKFLHPVTFQGRKLASQTVEGDKFTLFAVIEPQSRYHILYSIVQDGNTAYHNVKRSLEARATDVELSLWAQYALTYPFDLGQALSYSFRPVEPCPVTPVSSDVSDSPS